MFGLNFCLSPVNNNLGITDSSSDRPIVSVNSNDQSTAAPESKFSPAAQKIILGGLGISSSTADASSKQIVIAKSIKGILATSIAWTDNSESEDTRGSITLTEPLKYENGDIALPENSSIIVEVAEFNQADFVTLRAIAIVAKNSQGKVIRAEIPEDSLLIRGENNQPLKFETKNSGNGNSGINQLLGSAVRGATRSLAIPRQVGSALSRTISGSRSRGANEGKFYFIEEETLVSIYVNSFLSIED